MADNSRVSDPTYNLISLLYHTLQAGDLYTQYIADAKEAGDDELAQFLTETQSAGPRNRRQSQNAVGRAHERLIFGTSGKDDLARGRLFCALFPCGVGVGQRPEVMCFSA